MEEVNLPMSVFVRNVIAWQIEQEEQAKSLQTSGGGDPWQP